VIVMVENGRLGNQIFQYAALRSVARRDERVLLLGFEELDSVFAGVQATVRPIAGSPLRHLATLPYDTVARLTPYLPGVGQGLESEHGYPTRLSTDRLTLFRPAWFQNSALLDSQVVASLRIRDVWQEQARLALAALGLDPRRTIAVHVRGGDYRHWPSTEHPAILPPEWYRASVHRLRDREPGLAVIVVSDDPAYASTVTRQLDAVSAPPAPGPSGFAVDFALLAACRYSVLSASSYALWAARFSHRRHPDAVAVGPRYSASAGFRRTRGGLPTQRIHQPDAGDRQRAPARRATRR
jgi:hypothetical protein